MNERAKNRWDKACVYQEHAAEYAADGKVNEAIVYTGLGELSLHLARFAVEHPTLVAGIDEDAPINVNQPPGMGGPKVWGAGPNPSPPLPAHIMGQTRPGEVG